MRIDTVRSIIPQGNHNMHEHFKGFNYVVSNPLPQGNHNEHPAHY